MGELAYLPDLRACSSFSCFDWPCACSDTDSLEEAEAEEEGRQDAAHSRGPSWAADPGDVAVVGTSCGGHAAGRLRIEAVGGHSPLDFFPKAAEEGLGSAPGCWMFAGMGALRDF